jgi:hypothetical protein
VRLAAAGGAAEGARRLSAEGRVTLASFEPGSWTVLLEPVSWARTSVAANRATAANALIVVFMAFSLFRMLDLRIGLPRP